MSTMVSRETPITNSSSLISAVETFVKEHMRDFDASHDYSHIERVVALARKILAAEQQDSPHIQYNPTVVIIGALMHDAADSKYLELLSQSSNIDPNTFIHDTLLTLGASSDLATAVQAIVQNVSYFKERRDPEGIQIVLRDYPELRIVQDADRLDAIGLVGTMRTIVYGGIIRRPNGFQGSVDWVHHERAPGVMEFMKTREGRRLGEAKMEAARVFKGLWDQEMGVGMDG